MQFLFPGFLWGLLAIGIPVAIHLLQLRRPQRVLFTNTGFIREIEFKSGRRRLQDLLVLVLRGLAVLFLVLAFCQPFIPVPQGGGDDRSVHVAVDNSASMQRPGSKEQLSRQAVVAAQEVGASYGPDARLRLLGWSRRATTKNAFAQEAAGIAAHPQQIGWGAPVVQQAMQANSTGALYVISDFQKNESAAALFSRLPAGREVVLVPQSGQAVGNVYVDSVWLNDAFVRVATNVGLHIRLRNGGSEEVRDCAVKVLLGKQQVAAYQVSVPAGKAVETVVQAQIPSQTSIMGQVQVADAPVIFDNTYYFTLRPASAIQVVEVGPVAIARGAYQQEPLFRYSYMQPEHADFNQLRQANLVLLSEATVLEAGLREALLAVVRRGGSVVVVPAAQAATHEATGRLLRELGAGNVQWETAGASAPVRQEVAMPAAGNPFFKEVFGAQTRQVAMPEASPVLRLAGGSDVLRLRGGEEFLTEFAPGAGRIYVFSSPFDKAYSDFTTHALFVPVLYRLAMLSYRDEQPLAYRIGQATLTLRAPVAGSTSDASAYRLVRDSVTLVPAQRQQGQQLRLELPAELSQPGFYQLQRQGRSVATLAFNAPKAESELASYSVAELRRLTAGRPAVRVLDAGEQPAALRAYQAEQHSRPLWRYCLLLALASLLAEEAVLRWGRRVVGQAA